MRTASLLSLLVVVGAGCARPSTTPSTGESDALAGDPHYLRGVETPYSTPISALGDFELLGKDSVMREALVAGDSATVVVVAAFRSDDVLALDMVVHNDSGQELRIGRDDVYLVDNKGQWPRPRRVWDGGSRLGLRGRRNSVRPAPASLPTTLYRDLVPGNLAASDPVSGPGFSRRQPTGRVTTALPSEPSSVQNFEFYAPPSREESDRAAPVGVVVPDRAGRVFWAYFEARELEFPLTAIVLVGEEQLIFRFEQP